jgi:anti-sigma factor RsiW
MVTCDEVKVLLHGLIDGELDAGRVGEVERHVAGCADCAAELAAFREMRQAMRNPALRLAAPNELRRRIETAIPDPPPRAAAPGLAAGPSRRWLLKVFALGSGLSAVAATGLVVAVMNPGLMAALHPDPDKGMLGDVVSAHLRSLQPGHLADVRSNDQHRVKPWFKGKLDVAPPVPDLTAQGFALQGGRLDYVDGKAVAAIVYRSSAHVINLFVAVAPGATHTPARSETVQGFNTQRWTDQGFHFVAISDVGDDELRKFHLSFEAALHAGATG